MNEQREIIQQVEELFRVSDLAIFALYRRIIELEHADEQTSDEL